MFVIYGDVTLGFEAQQVHTLSLPQPGRPLCGTDSSAVTTHLKAAGGQRSEASAVCGPGC